MADTITRLAGPLLLTNAAATLYTVPAATRVTLRDIEVCNESAADATVTLSIGADGAGKRLLRSRVVSANGSLQWTGSVQLEAGELIQGYSGTTNVLTIIITGIVSTP